uniref:Cnidarian restricted protein n=1 Tax=Clytia hemisphaerica TaxID=252671 RepID=A0A7M6DNW2_9CNID
MEMASSIQVLLTTTFLLFILPYSQCGCSLKHTGRTYEGDGEGEVQYLDRHYVDCYNGALNFLKLERRNAYSDIRYAYKCCDQGLLGVKWSGKTSERLLMGFKGSRYSIWELGKGDGMKMDCGSDGAISSFVLKTNWSLHLVFGHYEYTCVKINNNHYPHFEHKSQRARVKRHLAYLDRLQANCGKGVIKSHKFNLPEGDDLSHINSWVKMAEEVWCRCPTGGC